MFFFFSATIQVEYLQSLTTTSVNTDNELIAWACQYDNNFAERP